MNTNNITQITKHRFSIFALVALLMLGIAPLAFTGCGQSSDPAVERATREQIIRYHNATGKYPFGVIHFENRYIPIDDNGKALTPEEQAIEAKWVWAGTSGGTELGRKTLEEDVKQRLIFQRVLADVQASNGK